MMLRQTKARKPGVLDSALIVVLCHSGCEKLLPYTKTRPLSVRAFGSRCTAPWRTPFKSWHACYWWMRGRIVCMATTATEPDVRRLLRQNQWPVYKRC